MSYFAQNYAEVRLPVEGDCGPGLRNAQLGAIHAVAAHFTLRDESAIVVMPTGAGKTAVLMLTPFLLRSERALVVTPSRLVRDQVAEDWDVLGTLRGLGVLPDDQECPRVRRIDHRVRSREEWEALREYDVVVATPYSVSPALSGVADPPPDVFDTVLIDEGHHSPASTWAKLLAAFPAASRVLFTATPFRTDDREIHGSIAYAYPLSRAREDGIFGEIAYVPVRARAGEEDVEIARATERAFREDRRAGLGHVVMVRTDTKARAEELAAIYSAHTGLKLQVIHSGYSYRWVRKCVEALRNGDLDGVVCVDMLGEGIDIPELKIAAIHVPHKSLPLTLQFIGRFARTRDARVGGARFLAVPSQISVEATKLYKEDAIWQEIVANLSDSRIETEVRVRESLDTFGQPDITEADLRDLSLYALNPHCHVKIYQTALRVDIEGDFRLPSSYECVYKRFSRELNALVVIAKERKQPRWTDLGSLARVEYDLFVAYQHRASSLLMICSSRRTASLYEAIASAYTGEDHGNLPVGRTNRVLRGLEQVECFNLGMRNRLAGAASESYRIIAGPQAQRAVSQADARRYGRGHVFVKGKQGSTPVTIGYSSASKVWSTASVSIPELVQWCATLGEKIMREGTVTTSSQLDWLPVAREVDEIPQGIIAATWHSHVYKQGWFLRYVDDQGSVRRCAFHDCDLVVDFERAGSSRLPLSIRAPHAQWLMEFSLAARPYFQVAADQPFALPFVELDDDMPLSDYLNSYPLSFFTWNFERLDGNELLEVATAPEPFARERIEVWPWRESRVDMRREVSPRGEPFGTMSIHGFCAERLATEGWSVIFLDDGPGEIADIVAIRDSGNNVDVAFFHCKGAHGEEPGARANDLYVVCGQVVKSTLWMMTPERLLERMKERELGASHYLAGEVSAAEDLLTPRVGRQVRFGVALVQPGASASRLGSDHLSIIAAAEGYAVNNCGFSEMRVICSS